MRAWVLAIVAALVLHGLILLFGGIFFVRPEDESAQRIEEVDLLEATPTQEDEREDDAETPKEPPPELEVQEDPAPEMAEVLEPAAQQEPTDMVARLEALSLGALESALDPGAASGEGFGGAVSFASGGRIGGTGPPGSAQLEESAADAVFDIGALDQPARALHQAAPAYPPELRQRKVEGTVYVVFVVDQEGRVQRPSVESSPNPAFDAPALAAVRRWRFEPAVLRGEKVRSKVRVPIRFTLGERG